MARTTLSQQVATLTAQVEALTQALAAQQMQQAKADKAPTTKSSKSVSGKGSSKTKATKKFPFTKHDGTVVYAKSQAQLDAWTKYANRSYVSKEEREERFAEHAQKMQAYKPSKALKDAIRKDRASITFAVAKEQYGFVGTKATLKALKAEVLSK